MLRELLGLMPGELLRCPAGAAGGCAALGGILWAVGARFSRPILTLFAVGTGTFVGMRLPTWRGWQIDGMGVAVGAALVLGTCVYLFHRTCIALLLGMILMLWAGTATWIAMAGGVYWNCRTVRWQGDLVQLLRDAWQTLPPSVAHAFPFACFVGVAVGTTLAAFFSKLAKVLVHSFLGLTLMVVMGAVALLTTHPNWLAHPAGSNGVEGGVLAALGLVSAVWQWKITPPNGIGGGNQSGQRNGVTQS